MLGLDTNLLIRYLVHDDPVQFGRARAEIEAAADRGEPLMINDDVGRIVHTNSYVPSPSPAQLYLRITEIMYHPARTNAGSLYGTEEFEYLELKNIGPVNLNLAVGGEICDGVGEKATVGHFENHLVAIDLHEAGLDLLALAVAPLSGRRT